MKLIRLVIFRPEDNYQRVTPFVQATRGGNDADHILFDGVCVICTSSLYGRIAEQVR